MKIIIWAMIAYGMSTILVYGKIFDKPRAIIVEKSKFFGDLISCMLCTSTWVGFFMSITLGPLSNEITTTQLPIYAYVFFDGLFTAGIVWMINSIVEFFEENRIK